MKNNLNVLEKIFKSTNFFLFWNLKKNLKIDKNANGNIVRVLCKMKFFDSAWFMLGSLSSLVDNLSEGIDKIECKDTDCFFEYEGINGNLVKYICLSCNKNNSKMIDKNFKN